MDMNKRWESYVMYRQKTGLVDFWKEFYKEKHQPKVLFLLGRGFDPRMNNILKLFLDTVRDVKLDCISFDFPVADADKETRKLYQINITELNQIQAQYGFPLETIEINNKLKWDKRIALLSRQTGERNLDVYDDVILDVSSLPRAFYFNIAKVLFNKLKEDKRRNLFFAVSENVDVDNGIEKTHQIDNIEALRGFKSMLSVESILDRINILIPLIGENGVELLNSIYTDFNPNDMYPVLPFPSKNPRRSDDLLQEYHEFFEGKRFVEPQSITYADEQNPFELFRIVSQMMREHKKTLDPISKNVCFGIALLTSKLLSLGGLLLGLEYNGSVAIYNVSSTNYTIKDADELVKLSKDSEPFLLWITGEAYNEN